MEIQRDREDLNEALRHCRAGLKALEAAERSAAEAGEIYPTHLHLCAVELARTVELALRVAMRNG